MLAPILFKTGPHFMLDVFFRNAVSGKRAITRPWLAKYANLWPVWDVRAYRHMPMLQSHC